MLLSKHFRHYYLKYILSYIIGIGVLVYIDFIQLDIPKNVGIIIDTVRETQNLFVTQNALIEIAILAIVVTIGRFIWRLTIFGASRKIQKDLMDVMFTHATKLSQSYYSQEKVGGLMALYTNDIEAVRQIFGPGILMLVDGLALGGFALVRMFRLNTVMTLYAGIPMLIMMISLVFILKNFQKVFKKRQESFESLSDYTTESFSGLSVIRAYVKEIQQATVFQMKSNDLRQKTIGFVKYLISLQLIISATINIIVLFIVVYGSFEVLRAQELTVGELTVYLAYFFSLIWPTMALAQFFSINSQAKASAERMNAYLNTEVTVKDKENLESRTLVGDIELKHLSFKYPDGDSEVLKDVSFKIKKGQMVGILGRTGSGKSSLVDLFLRTHNVNEGQLFIDGIDVMDLKIADVRQLMGYVPQDNFLFSETIEDNIAFAFDDESKANVISAATLSDVHDNIIGFKDGYKTMLGERGVTVSGGQKQRLSIARAIAKDPEILILDDSVSAVDTKTEEAIIKNLFKIRKHKTTIFIAHRISTVKHMDLIILLDKGSLVGIGTHEQLLETSSLYQDMVKRQQLEYMIEEGNNERL
jgi:ATP-binding cassette, subfamily B, multidrug efflux pump